MNGMNLITKIRKAQDMGRKTKIWHDANLSREQAEEVAMNMVLTVPVGCYKLHGREYGTNLVDTVYDMYGWMPSMFVSEAMLLGLQAMYPDRVYASFTHGLDAIEIKPLSKVVRKVRKACKSPSRAGKRTTSVGVIR